MRIIGFIPARKGSKGLPNKNELVINGKPLIAYTIEAAIKSNLDEIYVSSDSSSVEIICKEHDLEFIRRPKNLASDNSLMHETIIEFCKSQKPNFDALMILQPTSPMRDYNDINNSIEIFKNNKNADCLVSVCQVPHNFSIEKQMYFKKGYLQGGLNISPKQNIIKSYARNGAIYMVKKNRINKYLIGGNIMKYEMSIYNSLDIENQEDLNNFKKNL